MKCSKKRCRVSNPAFMAEWTLHSNGACSEHFIPLRNPSMRKDLASSVRQESIFCKRGETHFTERARWILWGTLRGIEETEHGEVFSAEPGSTTAGDWWRWNTYSLILGRRNHPAERHRLWKMMRLILRNSYPDFYNNPDCSHIFLNAEYITDEWQFL
jgi:hypothetical protein